VEYNANYIRSWLAKEESDITVHNILLQHITILPTVTLADDVTLSLTNGFRAAELIVALFEVLINFILESVVSNYLNLISNNMCR
jgi:hypothetical protein